MPSAIPPDRDPQKRPEVKSEPWPQSIFTRFDKVIEHVRWLHGRQKGPALPAKERIRRRINGRVELYQSLHELRNELAQVDFATSFVRYLDSILASALPVEGLEGKQLGYAGGKLVEGPEGPHVEWLDAKRIVSLIPQGKEPELDRLLEWRRWLEDQFVGGAGEVALPTVRQPAEPTWERIEIHDDRVVLDGHTYPLTGNNHAGFLRVLQKAKGGLVGAEAITKTVHERPDRIYRKLPPELQGIITSPPGRGRFGYAML